MIDSPPHYLSAQTIIKEAFDRLESSISKEDARDFLSTTRNDVRHAAKVIQDRQAQRKSLQNLRRIEPFLRFTEKYAPILEVACQGFSPIAWVWGPLKLMLQLASQYAAILEKLLDAYAQIAEELPRIDRLNTTFGQDESFQKALALIYTDIVEFHQRAYKFFRRRAWQMFFESTWRSFEHRFQGVLVNLRRHTDLLDKEAASINFADTKRLAQETRREAEERERKECERELQEVLDWLAPSRLPDERQEKLSSSCHPGTCDWLLENPTLLS